MQTGVYVTVTASESRKANETVALQIVLGTAKWHYLNVWVVIVLVCVIVSANANAGDHAVHSRCENENANATANGNPQASPME